MKTDELSLRDLRAFGVMLRERSLTQAAYALNTTQPTVSKTLAKLRTYFHDPLFVRVGAEMHPTPKALELCETVRELVLKSESLRSNDEAFDPQCSRRLFRLLLTDVGMISLLPEILRHLESHAPRVRLVAVPMDSHQLESKLESGEADIAVGAFPRANRGLRRQHLYTDTYVSMVRRSHPRLAQLGDRSRYLAEQHVLISQSACGHAAHELIACAFEEQVAEERIWLRVPTFAAIAAVIAQTDAVGTVPAQLAASLQDQLNLCFFASPLSLPSVEIAQFWHERYQRDAGHRWMRTVLSTLFRARNELPIGITAPTAGNPSLPFRPFASPSSIEAVC